MEAESQAAVLIIWHSGDNYFQVSVFKMAPAPSSRSSSDVRNTWKYSAVSPCLVTIYKYGPRLSLISNSSRENFHWFNYQCREIPIWIDQSFNFELKFQFETDKSFWSGEVLKKSYPWMSIHGCFSQRSTFGDMYFVPFGLAGNLCLNNIQKGYHFELVWFWNLHLPSNYWNQLYAKGKKYLMI